MICNPPYFTAGQGSASPDAAREAALREGERAELGLWAKAACRRARVRGSVTFVIRADRLPELLTALSGSLGGIAVLPVASRSDRPAGRVLAQGWKGSRAPFRLLAPLVMHAGARHAGDGDDHSPEAQAVLRDGAALSLQ